VVAAPQEIVTMRTYGAIAASGGGRNHSFAITSNGNVLTWGKVRVLLLLLLLDSRILHSTPTPRRTSLGSWDMASAATKWNPFLSKFSPGFAFCKLLVALRTRFF